jgi:hypothetical protein
LSQLCLKQERKHLDSTSKLLCRFRENARAVHQKANIFNPCHRKRFKSLIRDLDNTTTTTTTTMMTTTKTFNLPARNSKVSGYSDKQYNNTTKRGLVPKTRENSGDRNSYDRDTVYVRCKRRKLNVAWCMPKVGFPLPLVASSAAVWSTLSPQTIVRYKRNLSLLSKIQSLFCVYYTAHNFW